MNVTLLKILFVNFFSEVRRPSRKRKYDVQNSVVSTKLVCTLLGDLTLECQQTGSEDFVQTGDVVRRES